MISIVISMTIDLAALVIFGMAAFGFGPGWVLPTAYILLGLKILYVVIKAIVSSGFFGGLFVILLNLVPYVISACITYFGFGFIDLRSIFFGLLGEEVIGGIIAFFN